MRILVGSMGHWHIIARPLQAIPFHHHLPLHLRKSYLVKCEPDRLSYSPYLLPPQPLEPPPPSHPPWAPKAPMVLPGRPPRPCGGVFGDACTCDDASSFHHLAGSLDETSHHLRGAACDPTLQRGAVKGQVGERAKSGRGGII